MSRQIASLVNINRLRNINYGYIIVAAGFLVMAAAFGAQSTFGVFFKPMADHFHWTRATTSGPFALNMIICGLFSIITGRLCDRFGSRLVVSAGAVVLGAGFLLMSTINSLWQLYLYYGVLAGIGLSTMYVPLVALAARWFTQRRGLFTGIAVSGIGFGIAVMPAVAGQLIEHFDNWRTPLLIIGGPIFVIILLMAQLLKNVPASSPADGDRTSQPVSPSPAGKSLSFQEALHTGDFWLIFVAWIGYGFFFQIGVVHIVPYAQDLKMTVGAAAIILSTMGIIGVAGRVSLGFIGDKIGNRNTVFIAYAVMGADYLALAFIHSIGMLYVFAVIFGYLFGIGTLLIPIITEYYGFKDLGLISGAIVFANQIGGAIGPPVAGAIFDNTRSYEIAFILCGVVGLAAALLIRLVRMGKQA